MAGSGGALTWSTTSVSLAVGETITVNYTTTFNDVQSAYFASLIASVATFTEGTNKINLTGTAAGTVTVSANTTVGFETVTANALTITVTAPVDDQNFLNERGLTHFWENIDDLKQDKLTAGDNISITSNTISADTGWVYLGEQSLSADSDTLTYTLPAQYDNYKVVFYGAMASSASDGCWIDFIMYNGSTAINVAHQVQLVDGTTWSSGFNTSTFAMNIQSNPYAGLLFKLESWRAGSNDWRHYTGSMASNAGSSYTTRTSIVNGRATSSSQPTAFAVKTYGTGNVFNTGATIRVWASNNEH